MSNQIFLADGISGFGWKWPSGPVKISEGGEVPPVPLCFHPRLLRLAMFVVAFAVEAPFDVRKHQVYDEKTVMPGSG